MPAWVTLSISVGHRFAAKIKEPANANILGKYGFFGSNASTLRAPHGVELRLRH